MKFAINYSPQAAALLAGGNIQIDFFKTPDWPAMIAEARLYCPVAVHFRLKARLGKLHKTDWAPIDAILDQTGTPFINVHLDPGIKEYPEMSLETPEKAQAMRLITAMLEDVHSVVRRYGPERVIVENMPYRGAQGEILRPAVEVDVIRRIVSETGCGFLLDISHARITAHYLGLDARRYIDALPNHRLKELHFTGIDRLNGRLQDHLPVLPADWIELEWALERIRCGDWAQPWLLAFEYGGDGEKYRDRCDPAVIASQAPRLYQMVH